MSTAIIAATTAASAANLLRQEERALEVDSLLRLSLALATALETKDLDKLSNIAPHIQRFLTNSGFTDQRKTHVTGIRLPGQEQATIRIKENPLQNISQNFQRIWSGKPREVILEVGTGNALIQAIVDEAQFLLAPHNNKLDRHVILGEGIHINGETVPHVIDLLNGRGMNIENGNFETRRKNGYEIRLVPTKDLGVEGQSSSSENKA